MTLEYHEIMKGWKDEQDPDTRLHGSEPVSGEDEERQSGVQVLGGCSEKVRKE